MREKVRKQDLQGHEHRATTLFVPVLHVVLIQKGMSQPIPCIR